MRWPIDTIYSPTEGKRYRTTLRLPWGYRINIFWRGDAERDHHDHPNDFWTYPLKGYWERVSFPLGEGVLLQTFTDGTSKELGRLTDVRVDKVQWVKPFKRHYRDAEYRHVILGAHRELTTWWDELAGLPVGYVYQGGFVSIVRESPNRRIWGFYPDGKFMYWKEYLTMLKRRARPEDKNRNG
jgi:hypothetical protein